MSNERIIVCCRCGTIYDLHYVPRVKSEKGHVTRFECKTCGMVDVTYKNLDDFKEKTK